MGTSRAPIFVFFFSRSEKNNGSRSRCTKSNALKVYISRSTLFNLKVCIHVETKYTVFRLL